MKIVIFENPDDTITVRVPVQNPVPGSQAVRRSGETLDEHFERLVSGQNRKGGARVAIIEHTDLPAAHENFKAARRWNGVSVVIDMPAARDIHAERIDNAKRLKARDLVEREMMGENITAEKTALRAINVQAQIAAAPNPTALEAIWPTQVRR